jgi:hypothetical protein
MHFIKEGNELWFYIVTPPPLLRRFTGVLMVKFSRICSSLLRKRWEKGRGGRRIVLEEGQHLKKGRFGRRVTFEEG